MKTVKYHTPALPKAVVLYRVTEDQHGTPIKRERFELLAVKDKHGLKYWNKDEWFVPSSALGVQHPAGAGQSTHWELEAPDVQK